jgi:hypothetical protein
MRDDTFRTEAEVLATLELPVLAFIPVIPGSLTQSWRVRVIVGSAGAAAAIALLAYLLWRRP